MSLCLTPYMVPSKILHIDYSCWQEEKILSFIVCTKPHAQAPNPSTLRFLFFHQFNESFFVQNTKRRLSCFIAQSTVTGTTELHPSPSTTAGTGYQAGFTSIATTTPSTCYSCQVRSLSQDISPSLYALDRVLILRSIRNRIIPLKLSE